MKNNFFNLLKSKLTKRPEAQMDTEFWAKFDQSFGNEVKTAQPGWFSLGQLTAAFSIAVIGIVFTTFVNKDNISNKEFMSAVIMEQDLLENIEMIEFMAENNLTPEEMELLMEDEG
jgi:hypothetical protein